MFPEAGQKLGPYEILGELGGGGMARVFRAWDGRLHREVAIKVIDDRYAMPGIGERFIREARAASGLNHPNICTIFDIGDQDGAPYLVMELLQGETLRERIGEVPMPVDEILRYGAEMADALAAAHARGIIHRDIKPANIFLVKKPNGSIQSKVLDFGLAKIEQYASEEREFGTHLTTIGATVGTVSYMSPEQARGEKLDPRSDLFSLGIVMYEMATGTLPFKGATSALVFVQLLGLKAPDPIRKQNGQIPEDLEHVIFKLLAKSPRTRYQSATELCDELQALAEKRSGWLTRMKSPPAAAQPTPAIPPAFPREPAREPARPQSPPRPAEAAKVRLISDEQSFDAGGKVLPARPGDPQGVRAMPKKRRDSSELRRAELKKEHGAESPVVDDPLNPRPSGTKPVRTSIAANPRMTYPTVAPYSGQISAQRGAASDAVAPAEKPAGDSSDRAARGSDAAATPPAIAPSQGEHRRDRPRRALKPRQTDGATDDPANESTTGVSWMLIAVMVFLIALVVAFVAWRFGWLGASSQTSGGILLLTQFRNSTGDPRLSAVLLEGLEIDLLQSKALQVRGPSVFGTEYRRAGITGDTSPDRLSQLAARAGATHYLSGEITPAGSGGDGPYTVSVNLVDIADNRKLAQIKATAANKLALLEAIDSIAFEVRSALGEPRETLTRAFVPLRAETTRNLDALAAYYQGQEALQQGVIPAALGYFEKAAALDSGFALAQIRLATLYREQLSELRSAAAARQAVAATQTSERVRLLAQYQNAVNSDGDLETGLLLMQRFVQLYPRDAEGPAGLAEVLRLEGRFTEALQTALQASALNPIDEEIYWQVERAMLCLNRFDSVVQVEATMQSYGLPSGPDALLAYHLAGKRSELDREVAMTQAHPEDAGRLARYAFSLDDAGRLTRGEAAWRTHLPANANDDQAGTSASVAAAALVKQTIDEVDEANEATNVTPNLTAGLNPSKAFLLAQGALNRALIGDCKSALALMQDALTLPHGHRAGFNIGMTAAFCGNGLVAATMLEELARSRTLSTAAREYMVPDLKAATALHAGDPSAALGELQATGTYDLVSLTPYLRGLAHTALNQPALAIADFETELTHRGATAVGSSAVYALSEIQIARAYVATGDTTSSTAAYSRFLRLWKDSDPGQRLVAEARSHVTRAV